MNTPETYDVVQLNAKLRELMGSDATFYPTQIELKFPRILAKIVSLWGRAGLDVYLSELMVSDRPDRQGFPSDVAVEIFRLSTIHGALNLGNKKSGTGWGGIQDHELYRRAASKDRT